ncbi:MAG: GNAT family N-acetyltransferase [bacterium]
MPTPSDGDAAIVDFRAEYAEAFYRLNRAWLDEHALYEPADEKQLANPLGAIIGLGGAIFVAVRDGEVVGTAAVIPHGNGEVELAKLTVAESERGRGLGRRLVLAAIENARAAGVSRVGLVSSTRLGSALKLYESMGFVHRPPPEVRPYKTADVFMEMQL